MEWEWCYVVLDEQTRKQAWRWLCWVGWRSYICWIWEDGMLQDAQIDIIHGQSREPKHKMNQIMSIQAHSAGYIFLFSSPLSLIKTLILTIHLRISRNPCRSCCETIT
jgi:hypothetical protein